MYRIITCRYASETFSIHRARIIAASKYLCTSLTTCQAAVMPDIRPFPMGFWMAHATVRYIINTVVYLHTSLLLMHSVSSACVWV